MQLPRASDYGYLRQLVFGFRKTCSILRATICLRQGSPKLLRNQGMNPPGRTRPTPETEKKLDTGAFHRRGHDHQRASFFRDSRPFELLRTELLPKLIEARRTARGLRFWSAACSTGQEHIASA